MAKFLRMVRQGRWDSPQWIDEQNDERQANALVDLNTKNNTLSVYLADTQEMTDYAVAALAANRQNLEHFDFAIIDGDLLSLLNLEAVQNKGSTCHSEANALHYDIKQLTVRHILAFVDAISVEEIERVCWKKVRDLIKMDATNGLIDKNAMDPKLREKLGL